MVAFANNANTYSGTISLIPYNTGSGRGSFLALNASTAPTGAGFATPSTVVRNQSTLLTVLATNGLPGTVQTVVVDASSIGNSASFSLVRSNLSNVFTNTATVTADTTAGSKTLAATITDSTPLNAIVNIALTVVVTNDVWNGAGANDNFTSNLNWLLTTAPGYVGDSLTFAGVTRPTPNMDTNYTVTGVTFDNTAGSFNIGSAGGNTLTFSTGGLTNVAVAKSENLLTAAGTGSTKISGAISGSGSLLKLDSGSLTISSNSIFDLAQATSGGFSGPLIAQAGSLTFNNGGSNQVSGELVIGGVITNGGAGNNAKVTVDNASLNLGSWFSVGRGNGVGGVSSDRVLTNGATVTAPNSSFGYNGASALNLPKGSVTLNNNSSFTVTGNGAAYLQLPGGVLSVYANATIEIWAKEISVQNWARVLDFNNRTANYLTLTASIGTDLNQQHFESIVGGATVSLDSGIATATKWPTSTWPTRFPRCKT